MGRAKRGRLGDTVSDLPSSSRLPPRRPSVRKLPPPRPKEEETVETEEEDEESQEDEVENEDQEPEEEGRRGRTADSCGEGARFQTVGFSRNGPVPLILTDPEVFDCPICFEHLKIPVFQCGSGHIVCSRCCIELMNKCPSCSLPINHSRNRAIEKVLESLQAVCQNAKYGCQETMSYNMKYDHEKDCHHAPCVCPITNCTFVGSSHHVYQHFRGTHKNSAVQFQYDKMFCLTLNVSRELLFLQEQKDGDLFILENSVQPCGRKISVSFIAPSLKGGHVYYIKARVGGTAFKLNSCTKSIPNWDANPPSAVSLLVPSDLFGSYQQLNLDIRIHWLEVHVIA